MVHTVPPARSIDPLHAVGHGDVGQGGLKLPSIRSASLCWSFQCMMNDSAVVVVKGGKVLVNTIVEDELKVSDVKGVTYGRMTGSGEEKSGVNIMDTLLRLRI
ncbi:hypothetical protein FRB90_009770, partial [Tulasnella sp. 427]